MVASGKLLPDGLSAAIGQKQAGVVPEHCVTDGGLDTDARGTAGHYQVPHSAFPESGRQVGLVKATEPVLVQLEIARLGCQLRQDASPPLVANQGPAGRAIGARD